MSALERYRTAVAGYEAAEARVRRFADARAVAVWDLARGGWSLSKISGELGVTRARVSQLIERGRGLSEAGSDE